WPVTRIQPSTGTNVSVPATVLPSVAFSSAVADMFTGAGPIPVGIAAGPGSSLVADASTAGGGTEAGAGAAASGALAGACGWQAASSRAAGNSSSRAWRMAG